MRRTRRRKAPPPGDPARQRDIRNVVDDILFRFSDGGSLAAERAPPALVVPPGCHPSTVGRPHGVDAVADTGAIQEGLSFWGVWFIVAAVTRFKRPLRRRQRHEKEAQSKKQEMHMRDLAAKGVKAEDFGIFSHRTTAGRDMLTAAVRASAAALQCERTRLARDRTRRTAELPQTDQLLPRPPTRDRQGPESARRPRQVPSSAVPIAPRTQSGSRQPRSDKPSPAASLANAWRRPNRVLGDFLINGSPRDQAAASSTPVRARRDTVATAARSSMKRGDDTDSFAGTTSGRAFGFRLPAPMDLTGCPSESPTTSVGEQSVAFGAHAQSYAPVGAEDRSQFVFDLEEHDGDAPSVPATQPDDAELPTGKTRRAAFVPRQELTLFTDKDFTDIPLPTAVAHPQIAYPPPDAVGDAAPRVRHGPGGDPRQQFERFRTGLRNAQRRFHADELERLKTAAERRESALPLKRQFLTFHCEHSEVSSAQDLSFELRKFIRDSRVEWAHGTEIRNRVGWFYDFYQRVTDTCASERVAMVLGALKPHFESLEEELLVPPRFAALVANLSDDDLMTQDVQFVLRHAAAAFGVNYVTFREMLEQRHIVYLLKGSVA
uniref:Uncharacterized protein n=1 Tax=Neobodo designis TaxID=312471 RepID=A0A7S1PV08_NEODS